MDLARFDLPRGAPEAHKRGGVYQPSIDMENMSGNIYYIHNYIIHYIYKWYLIVCLQFPTNSNSPPLTFSAFGRRATVTCRFDLQLARLVQLNFLLQTDAQDNKKTKGELPRVLHLISYKYSLFELGHLFSAA